MSGFASYLPLIILANCSLAAGLRLFKNYCELISCGPHSKCNSNSTIPHCSCMPGYGYYKTSSICTKLQCDDNSDCELSLACIKRKCIDPRKHKDKVCGKNAKSIVHNHIPRCSCRRGYTGNPLTRCKKSDSVKNLCHSKPCGLNAVCRKKNGAGKCLCEDGYKGDPYVKCKPKCEVNSECPSQLACINEKCINPCRKSCGRNAICIVINHQPICVCEEGLLGDPFVSCYPEESKDEPEHIYRSTEHDVHFELSTSSSPNRRMEYDVDFELSTSLSPTAVGLIMDSCDILLCGPHSKCNSNSIPRCSCMPGYGYVNYETLPTCTKLQCDNNSDCELSLACINRKCTDPCALLDGVCAKNAECILHNHIPRCSCRRGYTGNPLTRCQKSNASKSLCHPNPCGLNAVCREESGSGTCLCKDDYKGDPYVNCEPKCEVNSDCSSQLACVNEKCMDPCRGSCGRNASCNVLNHHPICVCEVGLLGDPFVSCYPEESKEVPVHLNRSMDYDVDFEFISLLPIPGQINRSTEHDVDGELFSSSKRSSMEPLLIISCSVVSGVIIISAIAAVFVWRILNRKARANDADDHIYEEANHTVCLAGASEPEATPRPACPLPKGAETQEYVYDIVYESRVQRLWESRRFAHERSKRAEEIRRLAASMPRPRV